ncbi:aminodeoxychorismate synthase component I [Ornithinimicrobium cryptoxanthini]|uniref:aminodeoxychorismate synthase n=1 Tax=Ornithinimicrobium cryptoxanthini TaxID=2934161 RepID=A0ABY4YGJ2_9MICO|nr:aminodeoxychorismate synthase component I [Ornithinimicrobium cryptoxanthini]USQ75877.1 aminodeoxychorismate synthase component I [Ornithinimicrobium cryptoxanthini]
MSRVLLIDNVDSFTYNIADLLHRVLGEPPTVWRHDHPAGDLTDDDLTSFDAIVVGPGPGRPQHAADMGLSDLALRQREVPVLGVCLGHQGMAHLAGDAVTELATPVHGQVSAVEHDGTGLFEGIPSPFDVVRYHSLEVTLSAPSPLRVNARATDDGVVMALHEPGERRWGVQFHPESVLSEHGELLVANFLRMAGVQPRHTVSSRVAIGDVHRPLPTRTAGGRPVRVTAVVLGRDVDTWALHQSLLADSATAFWLDASGTGSASGRCSVMGDASGPLSYVLTHRVGTGDPSEGAGAVTELSTGERLEGPLLPNLARLCDRLRVSDAAELPGTFRPGFVGYLGYELKAELGGSAAHASPHPDARLVMADRAVVVDHEEGTAHAVYLWDAKTQAEQVAWVETARAAVDGSPQRPTARILHSDSSVEREGAMQLRAGGGLKVDGADAGGELDADEDSARGEATFRHTQLQYLDLIAQCQREIRAGESYEICLTNTATWPGRVDEATLAAGMREASPVPFAAWLRGPGTTVLSASPERFVSVSADGAVEARPIKGTRPRGTDPQADAALVEDLRTFVKDRAENLMIVDLLRNDLHRVCRPGSVHVPSIFEVETYATVHQLVSTVRGQLAEGMDCLDVIGTCFPGGSMTGAPKVRTMQILDRLEGGPRGVYAGALGWIGLDGAMDLSIVIRTVTLSDGVAEFGVGGAITALSDPAEEYAETQVKARALTRALAAAAE